MTLSTHVLDTESGRPVSGVGVRAEQFTDAGWQLIGSAVTDGDGRAVDLVPAPRWLSGRWRIILNTADHHGPQSFYPQVTIEFAVAAPVEHHHIPLLLSRHGYSTYRGS